MPTGNEENHLDHSLNGISNKPTRCPPCQPIQIYTFHIRESSRYIPVKITSTGCHIPYMRKLYEIK